MAKYPSMVITKDGLSMIAESQGGQGLIFTKVTLGAGDLNGGSIINLTDLIDNRINANITAIDATSRPGQVTLTAVVSNSEVDAGFHAKEIGVFAKIGEGGTERLYAYTNAGNYADYMPDKTDPVNEAIFKTTFVVSNAQNIQAVIDKSIVYPTVLEMDRAIQTHSESETAHYNMTGAAAKVAGKRGFVPAPAAGKQTSFLCGDGTWCDIATLSQATDGTDDLHPMTPRKTKEAIMAHKMTFIDLLPVGWVSYKEFLLPQHVKANGATVNRSDYPSLAAYATEHNLWTDDPASEPYKYGRGDGSTTMVLPDYRNRVIQGGDITAIKAPGLPNIEGYISSRNGAFSTQNGLFTSLSSSSAASTDRGYTGVCEVRFDASITNSIYGASTTVQPPALQVIPQIKC